MATKVAEIEPAAGCPDLHQAQGRQATASARTRGSLPQWPGESLAQDLPRPPRRRPAQGRG
eukprot:4740632-Lingulodinium_polyedra.AAC.1